MTEIDRLNLIQAAQENPQKAIVFEGGFFDGEIKKPFGLVPNNFDGNVVCFYYKKENKVY